LQHAQKNRPTANIIIDVFIQVYKLFVTLSNILTFSVNFSSDFLHLYDY